MDTIFIREFRVDAWVGIYEWEKQRAQTLEMEIDIGIPGNEVGRTDNIHHTINYGEVVERIAPYVDLGFQELVFHFPGDDQARAIDEFASDVLPLLRS